MEVHEVFNEDLDDIMKQRSSNYYERLDGFYTTCDMETMKTLVEFMPIRLRKWKKGFPDCDDMAYDFWRIVKNLFPTLAIGVCHVKIEDSRSKHAMCWCVVRLKSGRNSFYFIEPETGKMYFPNFSPYMMLI